MDKNEMKSIVVAAILFFLLLLIIAFVVPYAYHYVTEGPEDADIEGIEEVPGGGIVTGLAFVLGLLIIVIVAILKILDKI